MRKDNDDQYPILNNKSALTKSMTNTIVSDDNNLDSSNQENNSSISYNKKKSKLTNSILENKKISQTPLYKPKSNSALEELIAHKDDLDLLVNPKNTDISENLNKEKDNKESHMFLEANQIKEDKERDIIIFFTVFIPGSFLQKLYSEQLKKTTITKVFQNIIIKEKLIVNSKLKLLPIINIFLNKVNSQLSVKNAKFLTHEQIEENRIKNNIKVELKNNEDGFSYAVKYLKKNNKPDFDLPGFDMNTPIESFKVEEFALAYDPDAIILLDRKASSFGAFYETANSSNISFMPGKNCVYSDSSDESSDFSFNYKKNSDRLQPKNIKSNYIVEDYEVDNLAANKVQKNSLNDLDDFRKESIDSTDKLRKLSKKSNKSNKSRKSNHSESRDNKNLKITKEKNNCCDFCLIF